MTQPQGSELDLGLFTVTVGESVREVMPRLARNGHGIAAVVEADGRVTGVVTDGVLRRAILNGHQLDRAASEFMLERPALASSHSSDDEVREILQSRRLRAIPIVDDERLVGI